MARLMRFVAGSFAIVASLLVVGCTSATPTPTAVPVKPTVTSAPVAKPTDAAPAATKPAATPVAKSEAAPPKPAEKPAAKAPVVSDPKAEWDRLLAAAKREGKVVVVGSTGELYRQAARGFEKAFPDIQLEWSGASGSDWAPKVLAERQGGQYLWDVAIGGAQTANEALKPNGVLAPLKHELILPDVLDDSKWFVGFNNLWMDKEGQYVFGFGGGIMINIFVNRSLVPDSELSKHEQLVDPKWKGKIVAGDIRRAGGPSAVVAHFLELKGEDWVRRFLANVDIVADERQVVEMGIRGRYPIMVGVNRGVYQVLAQEGLTKDLRPLDLNSELGGFLSTGPNHISLVDKAPHPNAAKVFINWHLSREGQQAWSGVTEVPSMRVDVKAGDPLFAPKTDVKYRTPIPNHEAYIQYNQKAWEIAREMFK